ncbi:MAG: hypothetical protein ACO0C9_05895 [Candidatus Methanosuratincola verstraetei]|jgi:hypothetical protein
MDLRGAGKGAWFSVILFCLKKFWFKIIFYRNKLPMNSITKVYSKEMRQQKYVAACVSASRGGAVYFGLWAV